MIYLCTGAPEFSPGDEQTIVSFPSGDGSNVQIALNRHQLIKLMSGSRLAMNEAFDTPQPELAGPILMRSGKGA